MEMTETQARVRRALPRKVVELNNSRALQAKTGGFFADLFLLPFQIAQNAAQQDAINSQKKIAQQQAAKQGGK